jgi:hypothetical protein
MYTPQCLQFGYTESKREGENGFLVASILVGPHAHFSGNRKSFFASTLRCAQMQICFNVRNLGIHNDFFRFEAGDFMLTMQVVISDIKGIRVDKATFL